ncbi:hypothetical protein [Macrococcus armenti]|uniref:hypothetical protein n=1 Tax=Macrococcus armenti TaxID=2875764 RepID=UPI001CCEE29C|nr:hypothetical protein [Macrococcus armenti]UBH15810.1 hypothetical protein LAU44_02345 [Macrococcus armenti]UBH18169.1 hypothetical protein LAU39_02350 [Macrococcus armenti]UBH20436.1 hypothetical protein LAU40_02345 [Macrococcus armenti]
MNNEREQLLTDLSLLAVSLKKISELKNEYNSSVKNERNYVIRKMSRHRQSTILKFGCIGAIVSYIIAKFMMADTLAIAWFFITPYMLFILVKFLLKKDDHYGKEKIDAEITALRKQDDIVKTYYNTQVNNSAQVTNINNELNKSGVYDRIPSKYATYVPVVHMLQYVNNMRADTLKEAINLYEQEMHNTNMQKQNDMIINVAQQNLVETLATKAYAKTAAGAAINAAVNSKVYTDYSKQAAYNSETAARNSKNALHYAQTAANTARKIKDRIK